MLQELLEEEKKLNERLEQIKEEKNLCYDQMFATEHFVCRGCSIGVDLPMGQTTRRYVGVIEEYITTEDQLGIDSIKIRPVKSNGTPSETLRIVPNQLLASIKAGM